MSNLGDIQTTLSDARRLANDLDAALAAAQADINRLLAESAEVGEVEVKLDVPYRSQLGPDAQYARGDCGTAALAAVLAFHGHDLTVDDVSRATDLPEGFSFTVFKDLRKAAARWGVNLTWARQQTLEGLAAELFNERPVIALVHYPSLPRNTRRDPTYPYSHWVVVVGIGDGKVIYHDPYHMPDDGKGVFIEISEQEFLTAWGNNHKSGNKNSDFAMIKTAT